MGGLAAAGRRTAAQALGDPGGVGDRAAPQAFQGEKGQYLICAMLRPGNRWFAIEVEAEE
jgi:hypothetical protein